MEELSRSAWSVGMFVGRAVVLIVNYSETNHREYGRHHFVGRALNCLRMKQTS